MTLLSLLLWYLGHTEWAQGNGQSAQVLSGAMWVEEEMRRDLSTLGVTAFWEHMNCVPALGKI